MSRFLQLHTLTSYAASLLNRDDVGFAKRIGFGGSERTRISSQCLKRHWRTCPGEQALAAIRDGEGTVPMSIRSRRTFERYLEQPLVASGVDPEVAGAVSEEILRWILPEGKRKQAARAAGEGDEKDAGSPNLHTEQVTVIGEPEMAYLLSLASEIAAGATDAKEARKVAQERFKGDLKRNLETMARGAGLDAALFGRMTTGDVLSRCDAAVHVAHAFTVHPGFFETDYFSALDDLQGPEETGSGHINNSELTTGLYYGYVVVDLPLLVSNVEGCPQEAWREADRTLASEVVRRLVHLVATVSPGAKLGATAPYAHASMVLAELGAAQPRSLANAFLDAVDARHGLLAATYGALSSHLGELDAMYGRTTARRLAALHPTDALIASTDGRLDLPGLAAWAAEELRSSG